MSEAGAAGTRPTLHALTGLRGIGALWVVSLHFLGHQWPVVTRGYLGVDLFFILSGFILSYVHASDFQRYDGRQHLRFLGLRLARIYPLHFVVLVLFAAAVFGLPGFLADYSRPERFSLDKLAATLLLVNSWGRRYHGGNWNEPTWSLSAEWLAYLTFPLIIWFVRRIAWRWQFATVLLVLAALLVVMSSFGKSNLDWFAGLGLVRMGAEFTTGCLLYAFLADARAAAVPWKFLGYLGGGLVVLAVLVDPLIGLSVFGFALLVAASAAHEGGVARLFGSRPLRALGEVSYSLYLCHWPLLKIRNWALGHTPIEPTVLQVALWLMTAMCAWAAWRWIEKPARRFGRSLIDRHASGLPIERPSVPEVRDAIRS